MPSMSQRTKFTTVTPLSPGISRQTVLGFLHDHKRVIDLNPLVKERHSIRRPLHAAPDELRCAWYSITDHASYLPGKIATGEVTYTWAFTNLPNGLQSHCYAPAGLDIRQRWSVDGSEEPNQPVELSLKNVAPRGLHIREDVDILCNKSMTASAKKTLKDSHAELVARLKVMAQPMSSARAAIRTDISPSGVTTATGQPKTDHNIRNLKYARGPATDGSKHLAVYSWLKTHEQLQPQQHSHSRSSSDRSTSSSGSRSSQNSSVPSPVSSYASTPSYRNMVVSPPTPPYNNAPLASPLWAKLQPPPQATTTTLASLSPGKVPPRRPPRPEEREKETQREKPAIRLIPEPLRIPRTTRAAVITKSFSPVNINNGPRQVVGFGVSPSIIPSVGVNVSLDREEANRSKNTSNIGTGNLSPRHLRSFQKLPTPTSTRRRKFSYDSTSSTENYLVTSPTVLLHDKNKKLPPPQHILSQSREYHEQLVAKDSPSPPSSPILQRLRMYMGTQHVSFDPFEPHPDYPHMSPYGDTNNDDVDDDDEYEDDIYHDEESDKLADSDDAAAREIKILEGLVRGDTLDDYYAQYMLDKDVNKPALQAGKKLGEKKEEEEESLVVMNDNDSGYADYVPPQTSKAPLPLPVTAAGEMVVEEESRKEGNQLIGATLSGPFVAAFDEFNICLP